MAGKDKPTDLTSLPGVGAATAKKLVTAKYNTVAKVAKASVKDLQSAGLSAAVAKKVHAAAKAASATTSAAKSAAAKGASAAKKTASKATKATKSAGSKAKKGASKAASTTKASAVKAVAKGQEIAEDVVEKTKSPPSSLKTKKEDNRKGSTIKVPRSVKDMPWFKKG